MVPKPNRNAKKMRYHIVKASGIFGNSTANILLSGRNRPDVQSFD
jgi:hypothetical protein